MTPVALKTLFSLVFLAFAVPMGWLLFRIASKDPTSHVLLMIGLVAGIALFAKLLLVHGFRAIDRMQLERDNKSLAAALKSRN
jgi:RsiW-degrading membrane proteinase PrsW (M82 family)